MGESMDELFGDLRGLLSQAARPRDVLDARSSEPSVEAKERKRRREIVSTLERAHGLDPRRYEEAWLPYLRRASLPVFFARTFAKARDMRAFMPRDVFSVGVTTSLGSTTGSKRAQDADLEHVSHLVLRQPHEGSFSRSLNDFFRSPHLGGLRSLRLESIEDTYNKVRTSTADALLNGLAASTSARGLEHLEFRTFPSTMKAWDRFASSHVAQTLRALSFVGPFYRDARGVEPADLARAALGARGNEVRSVRLERCCGVDSASAWEASFPHLEALELVYTQDEEELRALASSTTVRPLRRFAATLDGALANALLRSRLLSEVEAVDLMLSGWATMMDADAVLRYLAVAPPSQVTSLCLTALGAPDAPTLEALAAWPGLSRTHTLSMWGAPVDAAGLSALLGSPHLGHLTALDLTDSTLSPTALDVLASSPALDRLTSLNLNGCLQDEAAARVIIESPHLGGLKRLEVRGDGFTKNVSSSLRKRHPAKRLKVVSGEW